MTNYCYRKKNLRENYSRQGLKSHKHFFYLSLTTEGRWQSVHAQKISFQLSNKFLLFFYCVHCLIVLWMKLWITTWGARNNKANHEPSSLSQCLRDTRAFQIPTRGHSGSLSWPRLGFHDTTRNESVTSATSSPLQWRGENFIPVRDRRPLVLVSHQSRERLDPGSICVVLKMRSKMALRKPC